MLIQSNSEVITLGKAVEEHEQQGAVVSLSWIWVSHRYPTGHHGDRKLNKIMTGLTQKGLFISFHLYKQTHPHSGNVPVAMAILAPSNLAGLTDANKLAGLADATASKRDMISEFLIFCHVL